MSKDSTQPQTFTLNGGHILVAKNPPYYINSTGQPIWRGEHMSPDMFCGHWNTDRSLVDVMHSLVTLQTNTPAFQSRFAYAMFADEGGRKLAAECFARKFGQEWEASLSKVDTERKMVRLYARDDQYIQLVGSNQGVHCMTVLHTPANDAYATFVYESLNADTQRQLTQSTLATLLSTFYEKAPATKRRTLREILLAKLWHDNL